MEYFVSLEGRRGAVGTQEDPLGDVRDAQRAVRRLADEGERGPVSVFLRGGTYRLSEPFVLTPENSGTVDAPVIYRAYGDEDVVLSGGVAMNGWRRGEGDLWVAEVGEGKSFHQLFVNGQRRQRARTPNEGFLRTDGPAVPAIKRWFTQAPRSRPGGKAFRFCEGDIQEWDNLSDVMIGAMHQWTATMHWIEEIDWESRVVVFTNRFHWDFGYWETKQRYYVENCFEALDAPGEWYYDRGEGLLYYWPLPREDMSEAEVIYPHLTRVIEFAGEPGKGRFVEHVALVGLSIQHTRWSVGKNEYAVYSQANDMLRNATIYAQGARNCAIEACEIAHAGEHAIWLNEGCQGNAVRQCHIHDIGAGGVYIGKGGWSARCHQDENPDKRVGHNTVDNCFIHDCTNVFLGAIGVWIGSASHNRVTHNEICDMNYMGVNVGWCWNSSPSSGHHNLIEDNHIHHITRRMLTDTAGVYTLGVSPGTVIRHNRVHDVHGYPYHAHTHGLYNDEGSAGIVLEDNIVYNTSHAGYNLNWGNDLTIRNNIFAFYGDSGVSTGGKEQNDLRIENNIFYGHVADMVHTRRKADFDMSRNVYWNTEGPVTFLGKPYQQWAAAGNDAGSVVADPQFVAPGDYDFSLKPDSPALDLGFEPIDANSIGLYGPAEWVRLPRTIRREPLAMPDPPRYDERIDDDFENYPAHPAAKYPGFPLNCTLAVGGDSRIEVTTEQAATGAKSLRFVDVPGIRSYNPHLYYERTFEAGRLRFTCDILNSAEQPAQLTIDFRDYPEHGGKYVSGPTVKIGKDGRIEANGRHIATVPPGRWFRLELTLDLSDDNDACTLTVTPSNGSPQTLHDIPYNKGFDKLTWLGLMSVGKDAAVSYIDNIELVNEP